MFSTIWTFFQRNRRKFFISGIVVGGLVVFSKYSRYKLNEWRKQEVTEMLQRSRRNQHFESTERSCNQTIVNLSGSIKTSVLKLLDSESVISNLKNGCCDKISGWNKLKVYSISKPAIIIYANTMLVVTLRIQLNLIGAYMFKYSQKPSEIATDLNETIQEKYLTLCSHFMDNGIAKLTTLIEQNVEDIIGSVSLTDKLSLKDIEQLYWAIMSSIIANKANDPAKNLTKYMLSEAENTETNSSLKKIINITLDLLESDEVQSLMQSSIRSGFVLLMDRVSEYFVESKGNGVCTTTNKKMCEENYSNADGFLDFHKVTIPMAKIIPILNGQVPDIISTNDMHADWLQNLICDEKLKTFGANIYEAFSF